MFGNGFKPYTCHNCRWHKLKPKGVNWCKYYGKEIKIKFLEKKCDHHSERRRKRK